VCVCVHVCVCVCVCVYHIAGAAAAYQRSERDFVGSASRHSVAVAERPRQFGACLRSAAH